MRIQCGSWVRGFLSGGGSRRYFTCRECVCGSGGGNGRGHGGAGGGDKGIQNVTK